MTISQQPETAPEDHGTDVPTGPVPSVPQQRGSVVDPAPLPPAGHPSRARAAWPWIAGAVITVLIVVVVALAAALAAAGGPPAAPAPATPTPAATVPTAAPAPATAAPAAPAAPPAPARTISSREWQQIAKAPDAHIGESVVVHGHVTQFDAVTGTESFRASVDGVAHRQSYEYDTNTILGGNQTTLKDLVQGDMFRAEVVVRGSYTYATTMGGQTTVPMLSVTAVRATGSGG